jgi:sensor histidine kinase YesM
MPLKNIFSQIKKTFMPIELISVKRKIRMLLPHIFAWGILVLTYFLKYINIHSAFKVSEYFLLAAINILTFYVITGYLFATIKKRKKAWLLLLILPLVLITGSGLKELLIIILKGYLGYDIIHTFSFNRFYIHLVHTGLFILAAIIYYFIRYWITLEKKQQNLQNEKNLAELQNLKSQVNPHFLFNTLNNLYYLCLKKDDVAPEMVMKLSELMRYIVSVGSKEYVDLEEEINHLGSYIELEKMRLPNPACIQTHFDIENTNIPVAPLLLLPFIENAFKHSKNKIEEDISISIIEANYTLHFQISNTYNPNTYGKQTGTGLENVRRRLNLVYPNQHQLEISDTNHTFKVDLKISFHADTLHSH